MRSYHKDDFIVLQVAKKVEKLQYDKDCKVSIEYYDIDVSFTCENQSGNMADLESVAKNGHDWANGTGTELNEKMPTSSCRQWDTLLFQWA